MGPQGATVRSLGPRADRGGAVPLLPPARARAAVRPGVPLAAALVAVALLLTACAGAPQGGNSDPGQVDSVTAPDLGACRTLTPADVAEPSNATRAVACTRPHTAETYAVGDLPASMDDVDYDAEDLGAWAYRT